MTKRIMKNNKQYVKHICENCKYCKYDTDEYRVDYYCSLTYNYLSNIKKIDNICQLNRVINKLIIKKLKDKINDKNYELIYDYFVLHKNTAISIILDNVKILDKDLMLTWGNSKNIYLVLKLFDDGSCLLRYYEKNKLIDSYEISSKNYDLIFTQLLRHYFYKIYDNFGLDYLFNSKLNKNKYYQYLNKIFIKKPEEDNNV